MRELEEALAAVCSASQVRDYLPIAAWLLGCIEARSIEGERPFVLGVNGPQGAGKSTLSAALVHALAAVGRAGIAISIDDFYLTHAEQCALAARFPANRFLAFRGYPGTHDVDLGTKTLSALLSREPVAIPAYDKSAYAGRGDRAPSSTFRWVEPPLDFVILEGWMLGFRPLEPAELARHPLAEALRVPNELLAAYAAWHAMLEGLVRLEAPSLDAIVRWRIDAERARRSEGRPALTDAEARDYIERFLPAYELYLPGLLANPPCDRVLAISLDESRAALGR